MIDTENEQRETAREAAWEEFNPGSIELIRISTPELYKLGFDAGISYAASQAAQVGAVGSQIGINTQEPQIMRIVAGALKSCIENHGPITPDLVGSASKRITKQFKATIEERVQAQLAKHSTAKAEPLPSEGRSPLTPNDLAKMPSGVTASFRCEHNNESCPYCVETILKLRADPATAESTATWQGVDADKFVGEMRRDEGNVCECGHDRNKHKASLTGYRPCSICWNDLEAGDERTPCTDFKPAQQEATTPDAMPERYFSFDPDNGIEFFNSEAEAKTSAEATLDSYRDASGDDTGWDESVTDICYGIVLGEVVEISHIPRPPEDEIDENGMDKDGNEWSGSNWKSIVEYDIAQLRKHSPTAFEDGRKAEAIKPENHIPNCFRVQCEDFHGKQFPRNP